MRSDWYNLFKKNDWLLNELRLLNIVVLVEFKLSIKNRELVDSEFNLDNIVVDV
jgi:hypothetical protein